MFAYIFSRFLWSNCSNLFNIPEVCNFEYGLDKEACYWTQDQADDFDWTISLRSYAAVGTGPFTDHTFRPRKGEMIYSTAMGIIMFSILLLTKC